jgi:hypothetical protein
VSLYATTSRSDLLKLRFAAAMLRESGQEILADLLQEAAADLERMHAHIDKQSEKESQP